MVDLKPCPFCGNRVGLKVISYGFDIKYHEHSIVIRCDECDFEFPHEPFKVATRWNDDETRYDIDTSELDAAVARWNGSDREWIPCSERIVEDRVLCCDNYGEILIGFVSKDKGSSTGFTAENECEIMYNCVAWMELPEAYKGSTQEPFLELNGVYRFLN